jgi:hypothetical protein
VKLIFNSLILILTPLFFLSCGRKTTDTPEACVTAFISAVEEHDMGEAWDLLGKDAQSYYNRQGEIQRRSGKGALENEIDRIKTFRSSAKDYFIKKDDENLNTILLITSAENEFKVETELNDGDVKIKDASSVQNVLNVISGTMKFEKIY